MVFICIFSFKSHLLPQNTFTEMFCKPLNIIFICCKIHLTATAFTIGF